MKIETREQALEVLENTRADYLKEVRSFALSFAQKFGTVTTDDLREAIPIPSGIDGRVMGAVFNSKQWQKVGYKESTIKTSHKRPIGIFKLVNDGK